MNTRMMRTGLLFILVVPGACRGQEPVNPETTVIPGFLGRAGTTTDAVVTGLNGGLLLAGGSTDVDEAMTWFNRQTAGGDVIILRASGSTGYNAYLFGLGGVNSVETWRLTSREMADSDALAERIRRAEGIFIAGGDQANYIRDWRDTKLHNALKWLAQEKRAVFGGTSAGCAVLGEFIFAALNGGVTSEEALGNPFDEKVSIETSFLMFPALSGLVTDQHYSERGRHGRHAVFMARLRAQHSGRGIYGIGVDEKTAVSIDGNGRAQVFGSGAAYFLATGPAGAEVLIPSTPLTWNRNGEALIGYRITGSAGGNGLFDLLPAFGVFKEGGTSFRWRVLHGVLSEE